MKLSLALILSTVAAFLCIAFSPLCENCFAQFHSVEGLVSFYAIAGILLIGSGDYASRKLHSRRQ